MEHYLQDKVLATTAYSIHSPGLSSPKDQSPTRARISRKVGKLTAAVIRRTWRLRPSVIVSSSQLVGIDAR